LLSLLISCYERANTAATFIVNIPRQRGKTMEFCTFSHFMETLKPWLDADYIHRAKRDEAGRFVLLFADGGQRVFQIEDCNREEVNQIIEMMRKTGTYHPLLKAVR